MPAARALWPLMRGVINFMRRLVAIAIFLILPSISLAGTKVDHEGIWQGFSDQDVRGYASAIMEIDESGKGFFAYTLSFSLDDMEIIPIDLSKARSDNGFYEITAKRDEKTTHILLLQNVGPNINLFATSIMKDNSSILALTLSWNLSKVRERIIDQELYEQAKRNL